MSDRLTLEATLVLVAVALGLAFGAAVLMGGGASAAKPSAKRAPAFVRETPAPVMDLGLTAARAVPALRASRSRGLQPRRPGGVTRRSVAPAVELISAPVVPTGSARPTPTAVRREVARPSPRVAPAPTPKPAPTPIGTPESSGDFDTTGEPVTEVTPQSSPPNATADDVTK